MRAGILGLILFILTSAGLAKAETQICGSAKLTSALQYVSWHQKNTYHNQLARYIALEESTQIQRAAKAVAWSSTFVFLICISLLAAAITYRVLENRDTATLLGVIYFAFFSFVLFSSREPIQSVTADFRTEVSTIDVRDLPEEVGSPSMLREFMQILGREQSRVPEVLSEKAVYLPVDSRWWTMGWDDVNLIDFQNEVFKASIRKGDFTYRAISKVREELEQRCRESGLEI